MASPRGTPRRAHSELVILNLFAEIMLGMLPGMSIPPEIKRPSNAALIWTTCREGPISAAVRLADFCVLTNLYANGNSLPVDRS